MPPIYKINVTYIIHFKCNLSAALKELGKYCNIKHFNNNLKLVLLKFIFKFSLKFVTELEVRILNSFVF